MKVLVLGGTSEGRLLATELVTRGLTVVSSLAGRVSSPRLPAGEVRIGGFGGTAGLAAYLAQEEISAVVDATHPFAAGITANAALACAGTGAAPDSTFASARRVSLGGRAGKGPDLEASGESSTQDRTRVPLLILRRPAWHPQPGDRWTQVADLHAAASTISAHPASTNVLLTTGRQEASAFAALRQRFILRAVEAPDGPLPEHCEIILDRGPFTLEGERELFAGKHVHKLVTKNSGGPMTAAKLAVARERGLEVVMVERPPLPEGVPVVQEVAEAVEWVTRLAG